MITVLLSWAGLFLATCGVGVFARWVLGPASGRRDAGPRSWFDPFWIGMAATVGLAAGGTLIICVIVEKTVGFRLPVEMEKGGMDHELHGEHGYGLLNLN